MEKEDVYYWMMMGALAVIALWVILKAIGIIQTPVWIQMIPYASAIFFAGTLTQSFRMIQVDIRVLKSEMRDVRERVVRLEEHAKHVDADLHNLKERFTQFQTNVHTEFNNIFTLLGNRTER